MAQTDSLSDRRKSPGGTHRISAALVLTVCLYALWGMAHNLNDILIAQFRKAFSLSDLQSSLVQSCFYIAYLVAPIPVMLFLQRFGYKRGVIAGLSLYAAGALLFWPAAATVTYGAFLGALFVIACGIVFLETAGTGIIVTLGTPERAEWRINVAQAFNPIGSITGVLVGRQFIFSGHELTPVEHAAMSPTAFDAWRTAEAHAVQLPYLCIALVVLAVVALVAMTRFPESATRVEQGAPLEGLNHLLRSRLFVFAVVAQFFYVGTQIGMWSFLIRYSQHAVPGTPDRQAALYLTISLVLFLIGRFVTLALLRRYSSAQIGMVFAAAAGTLAAIAIAAPGPLGIGSLVAVSFFMSIMYPGIYAIGLHGNEQYSKPASALMIMSIVAGAVLTAAMGAISDRFTIALAYLVPFVGFVVVFLFFLTAVRSGRTGAAIAIGH
jgi:FHS family L-fucose permease-like MFS transporter